MERGLFRPRLFSGNRPYHREFCDWLPEHVHLDHLRAAQDILGAWFGSAPQTLVPPGNVLSPKTVAAAASLGLRFISRRGAAPAGAAAGITFIDDSRVLAFHDRDIAKRGLEYLKRQLDAHRGARFVTVRELGEIQESERAG